ncbi:hypothetical protein FJTKL_09967 [Diaporthe vaccinii]|uniref:Transposase n=1 Tax=Diaporthe vaccinii TaxID=105482 RepID=A0ABR4ELQ5_9PEZI
MRPEHRHGPCDRTAIALWDRNAGPGKVTPEHSSEGPPVSIMYRSLEIHTQWAGTGSHFCLDETTFNEVAIPGTCSRWIEQDETLGINERTDDETRRGVELVREFQKNVVESNDSLVRSLARRTVGT